MAAAHTTTSSDREREYMLLNDWGCQQDPFYLLPMPSINGYKEEWADSILVFRRQIERGSYSHIRRRASLDNALNRMQALRDTAADAPVIRFPTFTWEETMALDRYYQQNPPRNCTKVRPSSGPETWRAFTLEVIQYQEAVVGWPDRPQPDQDVQRFRDTQPDTVAQIEALCVQLDELASRRRILAEWIYTNLHCENNGWPVLPAYPFPSKEKWREYMDLFSSTNRSRKSLYMALRRKTPLDLLAKQRQMNNMRDLIRRHPIEASLLEPIPHDMIELLARHSHDSTLFNEHYTAAQWQACLEHLQQEWSNEMDDFDGYPDARTQARQELIAFIRGRITTALRQEEGHSARSGPKSERFRGPKSVRFCGPRELHPAYQTYLDLDAIARREELPAPPAFGFNSAEFKYYFDYCIGLPKEWKSPSTMHDLVSLQSRFMSLHDRSARNILSVREAIAWVVTKFRITNFGSHARVVHRIGGSPAARGKFIQDLSNSIGRAVEPVRQRCLRDAEANHHPTDVSSITTSTRAIIDSIATLPPASTGAYTITSGYTTDVLVICAARLMQAFPQWFLKTIF